MGREGHRSASGSYDRVDGERARLQREQVAGFSTATHLWIRLEASPGGGGTAWSGRVRHLRARAVVTFATGDLLFTPNELAGHFEAETLGRAVAETGGRAIACLALRRRNL